jgi:hypothetical protein
MQRKLFLCWHLGPDDRLKPAGSLSSVGRAITACQTFWCCASSRESGALGYVGAVLPMV